MVQKKKNQRGHWWMLCDMWTPPLDRDVLCGLSVAFIRRLCCRTHGPVLENRHRAHTNTPWPSEPILSVAGAAIRVKASRSDRKSPWKPQIRNSVLWQAALAKHSLGGFSGWGTPSNKGFQVPATCLERRQHLLVRERQQPYTLSNLDFVAQSLALSAKKTIRPSPPVPESAASWWSSLR